MKDWTGKKHSELFETYEKDNTIYSLGYIGLRESFVNRADIAQVNIYETLTKLLMIQIDMPYKDYESLLYYTKEQTVERRARELYDGISTYSSEDKDELIGLEWNIKGKNISLEKLLNLHNGNFVMVHNKHWEKTLILR